jgi:general secretion pathway protein L
VRADGDDQEVQRPGVNFKDLLNTDHEAIIQWLMHGFRWWVDELMTMVPPHWRDRFLRRTSTVAELHDNGIVYRQEETGEQLPAKPRGPVKLLMPAGQVLTRQVDLPILPASDLKRVVTLDLDRLTPFRSENVLFDTEIVGRDDENGRQQVVIGVLPRNVAAKAMERARASDLEPAAIGVQNLGQKSNLNFLPAFREAEGGSAARRRAVYWWAAAGVLMVFNLFMLNYRDASQTSQLREAVESQQAPVTVAMRLRDKVQKEAARRGDLLKQIKQNSPLQVLDAVSQALPDGTWVEHFEWNGKTVHIRGFRKDTPNLLAKLEASPLLRNAHSLSSDPRAAMNATGAFDLAADREMERTR